MLKIPNFNSLNTVYKIYKLLPYADKAHFCYKSKEATLISKYIDFQHFIIYNFSSLYTETHPNTNYHRSTNLLKYRNSC